MTFARSLGKKASFYGLCLVFLASTGPCSHMAHATSISSPATSSSSSPHRMDSPSVVRSQGPAMEVLPLWKHQSDVDLRQPHFKIPSWTFPFLKRLDQSISVFGGRSLIKPVPARDAYFQELVQKAQASKQAILIKDQEVRGEMFLPHPFEETATYKAIVYAPGSGGLCMSERTLVTRMADELNALVFVVESNRSRAGQGQTGSSSENQLDQNHLNIALDVLRMAEILDGHPNIKGFAAAGSSLGAVALSALADRNISGPLYGRSYYVDGEVGSPTNHWANASPFQALFLMTPIFPVQVHPTQMPLGVHTSLFVGDRDMWCEPFSAMRAIPHIQGGMSLHLLKMGHGPECDWGEWDGRIVRHSETLTKLNESGVELIYSRKGENISRCTHAGIPFEAMALATRPNFMSNHTPEEMAYVAPFMSGPLAIGLGLRPSDDVALHRGLNDVMERTTKGTLLEPNPDAVSKMLTIMRAELATFVTGALWDEGLFMHSWEETMKAKALAQKAIAAFDSIDGRRIHAVASGILARPRATAQDGSQVPPRMATQEEILEMRACYMRVLGPLAEEVS
ncbi:MAG: hypothetical protein C0514_07510 [Candidatus Puniceispirillum sp.]|nr:hypothetical protein [Candidatus Puniceispirillum sp.]